MQNNILQNIRASSSGFSKGQKRIADFILNNSDKAAFMTAAKLGVSCQVSESTVVRFAAELGYDGYPAMQRALQEIIRGKLTSLQRIRVDEEQTHNADVFTRVMQRDMDAIHTAITETDRGAFDTMVEKLLGARRIFILGLRSSSFLAGYLNFYLHLIFKNVVLVQNSAAGEIYEQMAHIGPGDVLLAISFPRYSKMVVQAADMAVKCGAEVLALTDSQMSPLYQIAECSLMVRCEAISIVDSMTAPLSLLNALILALARRKSDDVAETYAQMEKIWSQYDIYWE